jgi:hypothetical protein
MRGSSRGARTPLCGVQHSDSGADALDADGSSKNSLQHSLPGLTSTGTRPPAECTCPPTRGAESGRRRQPARILRRRAPAHSKRRARRLTRCGPPRFRPVRLRRQRRPTCANSARTTLLVQVASFSDAIRATVRCKDARVAVVEAAQLSGGGPGRSISRTATSHTLLTYPDRGRCAAGQTVSRRRTRTRHSRSPWPVERR